MKTSNLSNRVEKSKKLRVTKNGNGNSKGQYNLYNGEDILYQVELSSATKNMPTPDGYIKVGVIHTQCTKVTYEQYEIPQGEYIEVYVEQEETPCLGNSRHTICYHCLRAISEGFESAGKKISFCETYTDALKLSSFGGKFVAIRSRYGLIWGVIKNSSKKEEKKNGQFRQQVAIDLMRNNKEGID